MKNFKLCALLAALLCAAALIACTGVAPDTATTAPVTTEAPAEETTEPATEEATDAETVTEAATEAEETTEAETECHILFEDNFDGAEIDTAKWNVGTPEAQPEIAKDVTRWDADKVTLDGNGHLMLKTEWNADERVALSGAVTTKGLFEAGYGYYEASIKFPVSYGRTVTMALTGEQTSYNILSSVTAYNNITYRQGMAGAETETLPIALINLYDDRFHTVGLLRSAEGETYYIDGTVTLFIPADTSAEEGYLSLFWNAFKGDGASRNETEYGRASALVVDYVRVYSSLPETLGKAENAEAQVLFTDDFDGSEIDFTKWKYAPEWTRNDYCYWSNEMSVLDGEGHLATNMEWDSERNSLKSGALWSAADYGYGYYEASIRFPKAYGTWGAFWMMCGDVWAESAADGVEIDIVESINNQDGAYNHNLHSNYGNLNSLNPTNLYTTDIYDGEFHSFGLLRSENGYFFYVDGKLSSIAPYYIYTPCPVPGRMELTVEAAGWAGAATPECLAQLPATMLTDYVRVYTAVPELN